MITFGQWMKQRRKALSLTQAELARLVSCSQEMINKMEGGQRRPSIETAKLLARSLKIAPNDRLIFISLARPDLSVEQIDEITIPHNQSLNRSTNRQTTNLPTPLTPLIGRAQEVSAICTLILDPDVRLVTLTGTGGMGKTRLSLQVATDLREQFVDGCWFISLAALKKTDLVIPTIARGLGIKEARDRALDQALLDYLIDKDMLLVLDNFEQIISSAKKVAEILALASRVKVLVTSRTVLHLSGEYEFVVLPLRFVAPRNSLSSEDLIASPAVSLFIQRARTVDVDFKITQENAMTVAKICARLDGLPLAIELAASHCKFLTPAMLLARLDDDGALNELAGGAQDLPARQQTMRRAIDWSYNLLNKGEQDLFRHLAVFVGGFTLEAAAAVCGDMTQELLFAPPARSVRALTDKLASLIDQSMLRQIKITGGESRFGMLESLHEYALERLAARGKEWAALSRRHARYFMALAEEAEPKFKGPDQEIWLDRLEIEHDNLVAALAWSCTSEDAAELGLRLAGAIWEFWLIRGDVNEGRAWLSRTLEQAKSASKLVRARALNGAGCLNWGWSDFRQAKVFLDESLLIFRELGDKHGTAWVLSHLGQVSQAQNELERAYNFVTESLTLFRELGADWNIAWDLINFGDIIRAQDLQGNEAQAIFCYNEALDLFRRVGDDRGTAWALDHLGQLAYAHQDYEGAMTFFAESVSLFRKLADKWGIAWVLNHLGQGALAQNDFQQARFFVDESLVLFGNIGSLSNRARATLNLGWTILNLGDAAWELGDEIQAKTLFTKSLKLFHDLDEEPGVGEALERLKRLAHIDDPV